jgi:Ca2+-binding RTX toxin-like protein
MRRLFVALSIGCLTCLALTPAHAQDETCTFEDNKAKVRLLDDDSSAVLSVVGVAITMNGNPCPGATTATVDEINVRDTSNAGSTGIIIDLSGGHFADGPDEIPFVIDLRTGTRDTFAVAGSSGDEFVTLGQNNDGDLLGNLQQDSEAEISFDGRPDVGLIAPLAGVDRVSAKGGNDTGGKSFIVWAISGGAGADDLSGGGVTDFISGSAGGDELDGDGGGDVLRGRGGNDDLAGRSGNDRLFGNNGDDTLLGGPGIDTCEGGAGDDDLTSC